MIRFRAVLARFSWQMLALVVILGLWNEASPLFAAGGVGGGEVTEGSNKSSDFAWMVFYTLVALGFSFLCSIAEAVVLSISPSYITSREKEGKKGAAMLRSVKGNIDRTLAAILTLNTIAHTVGAGGAGAYANLYFGSKYMGAAMAVLTLLILFLSEIIPKTLGAAYWRALALPTGYFVKFLCLILFPLIFVSELLTKMLTGGKAVHAMSREEFVAMADIGAEHGHFDAKESRILKNLFRFSELQAGDVMTPNTVVLAFQQDRTVADVLHQNPEINFSRIPIYDDTRDQIQGFVLKTDMLLNQANRDGVGKLRDFKRELHAVHEDTPLSTVFDEMLNGRQHLMLVVDEYGGMEGLVSLEDVVETLIGMEIVDEADKDVDMRALARKRWHDRMEKIGINVKEPDAQLPEDPPSKQ